MKKCINCRKEHAGEHLLCPDCVAALGRTPKGHMKNILSAMDFMKSLPEGNPYQTEKTK
jgi:hypothetical protein